MTQAAALLALALSAQAPALPSPGHTAEATEFQRLDIAEQHISRTGYEVAKALVAHAADGQVTLRVGASLTAARIDVHLRNVRGLYRFRARLEDLRQRWTRPPAP